MNAAILDKVFTAVTISKGFPVLEHIATINLVSSLTWKAITSENPPTANDYAKAGSARAMRRSDQHL